MTLFLEHVLHGLALLDNSKLLPGANYCLRGATSRRLSRVSHPKHLLRGEGNVGKPSRKK